MAAEGPTIPQLFSQLDLCGKNGDYTKGFKVATQILRRAPTDPEAFQCKVVCLLQQSKFKEALKLMSEHQKFSESMELLKAYCHYRLNNLSEAKSLLTPASPHSSAHNELLSQVLYRLEDHEASLVLYRSLIKHSQDEFGDERESNFAAVLAGCKQTQSTEGNVMQLRSTTYELCYNKACFFLNQGQREKALEMLKMAEELCSKSLQDDPDFNEEDIEDELGVIRVQTAYTLQKLGQNDGASKLYAQVLKRKPTDVSVAAVASNNVICMNKDRDLFDSTKKAKSLLSDQLAQKLNANQKSSMLLNRCLLLLYTNQAEQLASLVKSFDPNSDVQCLMQAAQLHKDRKANEAIGLLQRYASQHGEAVRVQLTLSEIFIMKGQVGDACNALKNIRQLQHLPGMVSCLVCLYTRLQNADEAGLVLTEAVAHWKAQKGSSAPEHLVLLQQLAAFRIQHHQPVKAAEALEELRKEQPKDIHILAKLIAAYSQFDPKKAEQLSAGLPSLSSQKAINVDDLEKAPVGVKHSRRVEKAESKQEQRAVQKKKKRKKKSKLPKNYDASVDPDSERWLPRRERSYYRKKGRGAAAAQAAAIGKGSQGAVSSVTESLDYNARKASPSVKHSSPSAAAAANMPSPQAQSARGAGQARKKQPAKKKKKGKGW
eukprot:m.6346 g.6346  ORF g.6346 m.6346 type:complete len:657 (+) comp15629_c0_seq2:75-2045(+)